MDPTTIAIIAIILCIVLIMTEMPVALAIGLSGIVGILLLGTVSIAEGTLGSVPYSSTAKYALFAIPTYVFLGCLIANAGIGEAIYSFVNKMVGRVSGGLAATAVLATAVFSGISGSSAADVATFGRISVNEMGRKGYERAYAAAVVAAAGTFAVLIPPSITLVVYAIIAEESIGGMLLAGVIPGALSCLILAGYVIIKGTFSGKAEFGAQPRKKERQQARAQREPALATVGSGLPFKGSGTSRARLDSVSLDTGSMASAVKSGWIDDLKAVGTAVVLFGIVIGGLYAGVFTATEAGAFGAFAALIIVLVVRVQKLNFWKVVRISVIETAEVSSMIFFLLIGGGIFAYCLAASGLPMRIAEWAGSLNMPPEAVIGLFLLMLIPLGAFLDGLSVLLLTVPIIAPIGMALGVEGIWLGILILKMVEIGLITPPVGINAFIISGITKIPAESVYRRLLPFVALDLAVTALFFFFPEIVLWLPRATGFL